VEKLGRWLRSAREAKGSTLEQAEAATRIRAQFLELLEAGDFAAFPGGDVQVRGFLRIYARYLDLSPREAVKRYDAEVHGVEPSASDDLPPETESHSLAGAEDLTTMRFRPRDIPVSSSLPRWMSVETVLVVGVVITVLLVLLAIASYVMNQRRPGQSSALLATKAPVEIPVSALGIATTITGMPPLSVNTGGTVTRLLGAAEPVRVRDERAA
jgi:cytoskeletal protein RodZ